MYVYAFIWEGEREVEYLGNDLARENLVDTHRSFFCKILKRCDN